MSYGLEMLVYTQGGVAVMAATSFFDGERGGACFWGVIWLALLIAQKVWF